MTAPTVAGYDLAKVTDRQRARRDAEQEALDLAVEADLAARDAIHNCEDSAAIAVAAGAASQAWAAVAAVLKPNGAVD